MTILGCKHAIGDHTDCSFQAKLLCTCGTCKSKCNILCKGKPYKSTYTLLCPYHKLAFKMLCIECASMSQQVIHPDLCKVHTNYVEASHNILTRFRSKELAKKEQYTLSTNLGLLQANMTYMNSKIPGYHWTLELYNLMDVPSFHNLILACTNYSHTRHRHLKKLQTECAKKARYKRKSFH